MHVHLPLPLVAILGVAVCIVYMCCMTLSCSVCVNPGLEELFIMELALSLRSIVFMPKEDVMIQEDEGQEMYFIVSGIVEVLCDDKRVVVLGQDQYFGELAIMNETGKRNATVRTCDYCDLVRVSQCVSG